jgi:hypothetical protein
MKLNKKMPKSVRDEILEGQIDVLRQKIEENEKSYRRFQESENERLRKCLEKSRKEIRDRIDKTEDHFRQLMIVESEESLREKSVLLMLESLCFVIQDFAPSIKQKAIDFKDDLAAVVMGPLKTFMEIVRCEYIGHMVHENFNYYVATFRQENENVEWIIGKSQQLHRAIVLRLLNDWTTLGNLPIDLVKHFTVDDAETVKKLCADKKGKQRGRLLDSLMVLENYQELVQEWVKICGFKNAMSKFPNEEVIGDAKNGEDNLVFIHDDTEYIAFIHTG